MIAASLLKLFRSNVRAVNLDPLMILITEWREVGEVGTWKWRTKSVHPPVILEIVTYIEFWSLPVKFKPKCIVYPGDYGINTPWALESAFASIHNSMRIYYRSKEEEMRSLSLLWPFSLSSPLLSAFIPKRFTFHPNLKIATILIVIETNWQITAKTEE